MPWASRISGTRSTICFEPAGDVSFRRLNRLSLQMMSHRREVLALMRFAVDSGDWRLVWLLAQLLERRSGEWLNVAHRTFSTLSARLGAAFGAQ